MIRPLLHRLVRRHAKNRMRGSRTLAAFATRYLQEYYNSDWDLRTNGEAGLLARLSCSEIRTVFDVGANVGEWTSLALENFPRATVHAFEISPPIGEQLRTRLPDNRVVVNVVGLSDCSGVADLHLCRDVSQCSTLHREVTEQYRSLVYERNAVELTTGDEYCRKRNVAHIDILKIDAEGHDCYVLKGLTNMLCNDRIDIIQFEYSKSSAGARVFLHDFYDILGPSYTVGRLTPVGVDFQGYNHAYESKESNFVAVRKTRGDYIALLKIASEYSRGLAWG